MASLTVTITSHTADDIINGSDVSTTSGLQQLISGPQIYSTEHLVLTSIVLGLMILCTIIGNVFVIAAILLEKNLHSVANYLILSLAVADLMVASIVMPIAAVKEVRCYFYNACKEYRLNIALSNDRFDCTVPYCYFLDVVMAQEFIIISCLREKRLAIFSDWLKIMMNLL